MFQWITKSVLQDQKLYILTVMNPYFILTVLKQVNVVVVAIVWWSYSKVCVPDVVKGINAKVTNLMLRTNETRHIGWYETGRCKYRLNACACNNKQRWNKDKCRCECKELIDKGSCDKEFI